MSRKTIRLGLNTKDINRAIREINKYKRDFAEKVDTYRKRIAEEIAVNASTLFANSTMDDIVSGSPRSPQVVVSVDNRGDISVVVAQGEDAVWCEFGAGVYHNGSVGASPNPYGAELGLTIGSYDKGHGKQTAWGYYDENNALVITRGTPASMPMYNSVQEITRKAIQIAREVWR